MKILSRYVIRGFCNVFVLALVAFLSLYLIIDFFEKIDNLLERQVSILNMSLYFLYKVPGIFVQGFPLASLIASLISLGMLKKNHEVIAMRSAGIHPAVYTAPILCAVMVFSIVHFVLEQSVVLPFKNKSQNIWTESMGVKKGGLSLSQENVWYRSQERIYQIRFFDMRTQTLERVSIFTMDPAFKLVSRLDARRMKWNGNKWIGEDVLILQFEGEETQQQWRETLEMEVPETPNDFSGYETQPEALNWTSLNRYIDKLRREGHDPRTYELERQMRLAFPATTLIMALLGITVAIRQGLHSGISLGVVSALGVAFAYLVIARLGISLASTEVLPVTIGVWAGNIIFAALGAYLWITDDQ
jgi:lipopolysaccharide export system permease protein